MIPFLVAVRELPAHREDSGGRRGREDGDSHHDHHALGSDVRHAASLIRPTQPLTLRENHARDAAPAFSPYRRRLEQVDPDARLDGRGLTEIRGHRGARLLVNGRNASRLGAQRDLSDQQRQEEGDHEDRDGSEKHDMQ